MGFDVCPGCGQLPLWKHSTTQLKAWKSFYLKKRKEYHEKDKKMALPPKDWDIDPFIFKTKAGKPLGELKAIKHAARALFDET